MIPAIQKSKTLDDGAALLPPGLVVASGRTIPSRVSSPLDVVLVDGTAAPGDIGVFSCADPADGGASVEAASAGDFAAGLTPPGGGAVPDGADPPGSLATIVSVGGVVAADETAFAGAVPLGGGSVPGALHVLDRGPTVIAALPF